MALDASVKAAMKAKLDEMAPQRDEAIAWIQAVTGEEIGEETLDEWLHSGVVLCKLLNELAPGSVKKIATSKMPFKQMENISFFLRGIRKLGVHEHDVFDTNDLFKGNDIGKVVQCVHSLGAAVRKTYDGPKLGVTLATANKREFTEAQLQEARAATSKLTVGSSDKMERSEVLKTGVTFGNDSAGGGGTATTDASKMTSGSAATMERSNVMKTGITFGNAQAGDGSAELNKLSLGSAGTMERQEIKDKGITMGADVGKPTE